LIYSKGVDDDAKNFFVLLSLFSFLHCQFVRELRTKLMDDKLTSLSIKQINPTEFRVNSNGRPVFLMDNLIIPSGVTLNLGDKIEGISVPPNFQLGKEERLLTLETGARLCIEAGDNFTLQGVSLVVDGALIEMIQDSGAFLLCNANIFCQGKETLFKGCWFGIGGLICVNYYKKRVPKSFFYKRDLLISIGGKKCCISLLKLLIENKPTKLKK